MRKKLKQINDILAIMGYPTVSFQLFIIYKKNRIADQIKEKKTFIIHVEIDDEVIKSNDCYSWKELKKVLKLLLHNRNIRNIIEG